MLAGNIGGGAQQNCEGDDNDKNDDDLFQRRGFHFAALEEKRHFLVPKTHPCVKVKVYGRQL